MKKLVERYIKEEDGLRERMMGRVLWVFKNCRTNIFKSFKNFTWICKYDRCEKSLDECIYNFPNTYTFTMKNYINRHLRSSFN